MSSDMTVATTILQQLGGRRFLLITGAKNPVSDGNTLRLELTKNKSGANRLWITLDGDDTYTMRFFYYQMEDCKVRKVAGKYRVIEIPEKLEEKVSYQGVWWDQLQDLFENATGLYTTLFWRD